MVKQYASFYTWSHALENEVIAHKDGVVSLLVSWEGVDMEMSTPDQCQQHWLSLYRFIEDIGPEYCVEFHCWRERDGRIARKYVENGKKMVRGQHFAKPLRVSHARHLEKYAMSNEVGLVITRLPNQGLFFNASTSLKKQAAHAIKLRERADELCRFLPGGEITSAENYLNRILQSYNRESYLLGSTMNIDPAFSLSEQILKEAPRVRNSSVVMGKQHTKVLYLYLYPDSMPAWFLQLSSLSVTYHVSHVIRPTDTSSAMKRSERETDLLEGTLSNRGRDYAAKGMSDTASFREHVAEHNLSIFQNAYIIHLHGDPSDISVAAESIKYLVETNGGQIRDADYIQLPFFRAGQPGQGYNTPILRPDHTWQVADMLPVQVYEQGDIQGESLRLGAASQLIGFDLSHQKVSHSMTVAMTGAGKGVDKVATIVETYPFGVDWYIAEIGCTYKWVVEAFGGSYTKIDPGETVVNPLPLYATAKDRIKQPLDVQLASSTTRALAFLLSDGNTTLDIHSSAAAEAVLQKLYFNCGEKPGAPTLENYFVEMERADYFDNAKQVAAASVMAENLHSFLSTSIGRIFTRQENLTLSENITGVDLMDVSKASPKLLKFYLSFLALRMSHMAFYHSQRPARVLLDEMHVFVNAFPDVVGSLISSLARMGRKENAAIDIVTQGITEIDVIEKEVLNSMPLRTLLYRSDEWDEVAKRINMPAGPLNVWKDFEYPLNQPYRPGIRSNGERYYNLHLTFDELMLSLADTRPESLSLKKLIETKTDDPIKRLQLFKAAINQTKVANA